MDKRNDKNISPETNLKIEIEFTPEQNQTTQRSTATEMTTFMPTPIFGLPMTAKDKTSNTGEWADSWWKKLTICRKAQVTRWLCFAGISRTPCNPWGLESSNNSANQESSVMQRQSAKVHKFLYTRYKLRHTNDNDSHMRISWQYRQLFPKEHAQACSNSNQYIISHSGASLKFCSKSKSSLSEAAMQGLRVRLKNQGPCKLQ